MPAAGASAGRGRSSIPRGRRSLLSALLRRARDPVIILPYAGFGTPGRLTLSGRVLQDEGFAPARDSDGRLRNLASFFRRLATDEVPYARLRARLLPYARRRARLQDVEQEVRADREGYFQVELKTAAATSPWQEVELELVDLPSIRARGRVLVPSPAAQFGVISDIDDTIVYSNVLNKLRMVVSLAFSNARTRKPFEGVAAFYRALHRGVNPVFYVSRSPWNLYAPLVEFMELQGLPAGPLVLRDFGMHLLPWRRRPRGREDHKTNAIEAILATYPRLPFVLIGDSGEQDPEIYAAVVRRHPERIRAIYIRSVNPDPARIAAVDRLVAEVAQTGCQLVLAPDSGFAAAHAAAAGLIQPSALPAIRSDCRADEASRSKPAASSGSLK